MIELDVQGEGFTLRVSDVGIELRIASAPPTRFVVPQCLLCGRDLELFEQPERICNACLRTHQWAA